MVSMDDVIPTTHCPYEKPNGMIIGTGYDIPRDTLNTEIMMEAAAAARLRPEPLRFHSAPGSSVRPPSSPTIIVSPPEDDLESGVKVFEPSLKDIDNVDYGNSKGSMLLASAIAVIVLLTVLLIIILVSYMS